MKSNLPLLVTSTFLLASGASPAAVLAAWTFETTIPATAGPFAPESGSGAATGFHATTSTYSNPAGNGSTESFSSNGWSVGDYYQFETSSTGFSGITITFDQNGSGTGPRDFKLQYSTDGASFTDFGSAYALPAGIMWATGAAATPAVTTFSFDLSSITALDNDSSIFFRLVNTTTTSIGNGTVAAGGTGRVDNVVIATVPEPASILLGALGLLGILRRRR
ncbi:MAG: PEP-CTERM sorting domain-containing protein [Verrucomicrobiota bacterium]